MTQTKFVLFVILTQKIIRQLFGTFEIWLIGKKGYCIFEAFRDLREDYKYM